MPLSLGYKARLIDPVDKFDNTSVRNTYFSRFFAYFYTFPTYYKVVICDTGLCEGGDYELLVQFEASPEPDEVGGTNIGRKCFKLVDYRWNG